MGQVSKTYLQDLIGKKRLSLQMAWLARSGDINMQEVEHCDDGADGNLKTIKRIFSRNSDF